MHAVHYFMLTVTTWHIKHVLSQTQAIHVIAFKTNTEGVLVSWHYSTLVQVLLFIHIKKILPRYVVLNVKSGCLVLNY